MALIMLHVNLFFRLEATNELLRDEHQALQLAYNSLEEKYLKNLKENSQVHIYDAVSWSILPMYLHM